MSGNYPDGIYTGTEGAPWNQPEPTEAQEVYAWAVEEGALEALQIMQTIMAEMKKYFPKTYKLYFSHPDAISALEELKWQFNSLLED